MMNRNETDTDKVILQTKQWIKEVVIGCNFCPFASEPFKNEAIEYIVCNTTDKKMVLEKMMLLLQQLDTHTKIETGFVILPVGFQHFNAYLEMVDFAENLLDQEGLEGIYQIASFHPDYRFEGSTHDDPANYTNRSPYPMLHILREESLTALIDKHKNIDAIPIENIRYARDKGLAFMKALLASVNN